MTHLHHLSVGSAIRMAIPATKNGTSWSVLGVENGYGVKSGDALYGRFETTEEPFVEIAA